jgi:hypothetical protein
MNKQRQTEGRVKERQWEGRNSNRTGAAGNESDNIIRTGYMQAQQDPHVRIMNKALVQRATRDVFLYLLE